MVFTPAPSPDARWRKIYAELADHDVGDVITYETLGDILDLDPARQRAAIQTAMRRAALEFLTKDLRAMEPVPNVGYQVIEPGSQVELAKRHQAKSSRSLVRGRGFVDYVDLSGMDPDTKHVIDLMAAAFAAQITFNRSMDVRQNRLERAVDSLRKSSSRTEDELADVKKRLADLEKRSGK